MSNQFKSQDDNPDSFVVKLDKHDANFRVEQDVSAYIEYAARSRENVAAQTRSTSYKPVCLIPDITAIDILTKYGIDVHSPEFMHDAEQKRKLLQIIRTDYPKLLMSNIRRF
jgi:hypothetical protein